MATARRPKKTVKKAKKTKKVAEKKTPVFSRPADPEVAAAQEDYTVLAEHAADIGVHLKPSASSDGGKSIHKETPARVQILVHGHDVAIIKHGSGAGDPCGGCETENPTEKSEPSGGCEIHNPTSEPSGGCEIHNPTSEPSGGCEYGNPTEDPEGSDKAGHADAVTIHIRKGGRMMVHVGPDAHTAAQRLIRRFHQS